jgi:hypothetical protein
MVITFADDYGEIVAPYSEGPPAFPQLNGNGAPLPAMVGRWEDDHLEDEGPPERWKR